ncbi:PLD nuclease N-terminal domain-containing protein [Arthrobacter sp. TMN-37]
MTRRRPDSGARRKSFRDLDRNQRRAVIALATVQLALMGAALTDLARRPEAAVRGSRAAWAAACFINFAGPLAYYLFGRRHPSARR